MQAQLSTSQTSGPDHGDESLTPLEQEVLDEYARLLENLNNVRYPALLGSFLFAHIRFVPTAVQFEDIQNAHR